MTTGDLIVRTKAELQDSLIAVLRGVNGALAAARDYGIHATWGMDEKGEAFLDVEATMVITVDAVTLTAQTSTEGAVTTTETRTNPELDVVTTSVQGAGSQTQTTNHPNSTQTTVGSGGTTQTTLNTWQSTATL